MIIKARYVYDKVEEFEVVHEKPTITQLEELLNDKNHILRDNTEVIIGYDNINVTIDKVTKDYEFYYVLAFDIAGYNRDRDNNGNTDICKFDNWKSIAVLK